MNFKEIAFKVLGTLITIIALASIYYTIISACAFLVCLATIPVALILSPLAIVFVIMVLTNRSWEKDRYKKTLNRLYLFEFVIFFLLPLLALISHLTWRETGHPDQQFLYTDISKETTHSQITYKTENGLLKISSQKLDEEKPKLKLMKATTKYTREFTNPKEYIIKVSKDFCPENYKIIEKEGAIYQDWYFKDKFIAKVDDFNFLGCVKEIKWKGKQEKIQR